MSMRRIAVGAVSLLACFVVAAPATACPFCESETGKQVYAGVFNDQFFGNLLLMLLPFPILLAIVALTYFDVRLPWGRHKSKGGIIGLVAPPPTTGE